MKKYFVDYISLFIISGTIIFLDQLTKYLVRTNIPLGNVLFPELWLTQYVRIVHWKNTGAAFGMFQSLGGLFMVLSFVVALFIIYYYPQVPRKDWLIRLAMGMMLGGALGNLIDRLNQGHVTDFISVGSFPVFNIADSCISVGVAILFFGMWKQEREAKAASKLPESDGESTSQKGASRPIPEDPQGD